MASATKQTKFIRKRKARRMGSKRRTHARVHGTTPAFPVHTPEADANAPAPQVCGKSAE